jgi:hypothetical protein
MRDRGDPNDHDRKSTIFGDNNKMLLGDSQKWTLGMVSFAFLFFMRERF